MGCGCLARKAGAFLALLSPSFFWKGSPADKLVRMADNQLSKYAKIITIIEAAPSRTHWAEAYKMEVRVGKGKGDVWWLVGGFWCYHVVRVIILVMGMPLKYYRWFRNVLLGVVVVAPFLGYYYVSRNMKRMEKGITDDLKRIEMKGRTLADIPKKY